MQGRFLKGSFLASKTDSFFGDGVGGFPCDWKIGAFFHECEYSLMAVRPLRLQSPHLLCIVVANHSAKALYSLVVGFCLWMRNMLISISYVADFTIKVTAAVDRRHIWQVIDSSADKLVRETHERINQQTYRSPPLAFNC